MKAPMASATDWSVYARNPIRFCDEFIPFNEKGQPWRLSAHHRRVLRLAFTWDALGALALRLLLWGEPKKSGKTFIAAVLGLWWGYVTGDTEVVVAANDLEQAQSRVFDTMRKVIGRNAALQASAKVLTSEITLSNGTIITAIAADYRGAAGARHSLVIYDELWGFSTESAERLWEELTPPPTEPDAWVLVVTYAGWSGESTLLEGLYTQGMAGARLDEDLEVYRADDLVCFWAHVGRQPWQTGEAGAKYYAGQRETLRPATYMRIHENRWVTSESIFITPELWDPCVDPAWRPLLPTRDIRLFIGVDAALKHDSAAVVGVGYVGDHVALALHRIWQPTPRLPLDLEATIEAYLRELHTHYAVEKIVCDPFQMHRSIVTLQKAQLRIEELPQTTQTTTAMGQALWDLLSGRNLKLYPAADMREQALNTVALEARRGWRIAKERGSKKIDSIVALSMAALAAIQRGRPVAPATATHESVAATKGEDAGRRAPPLHGFFGTRSAHAAHLVGQLEHVLRGGMLSETDDGRGRRRFWR